MLRRDFLIGAAAGVAAAFPAWADPPKPFRSDLWPPLTNRAEFVAWGVANRGEDATFLGRRFDRYKEVLAFNDLYTSAEKRAFLLTPREEFVLPEDRDNAYVGHYLDIGFGVSITPPGTMGRMTSTLGVRPGDKVLEIGTGSGYQSALLSYLTNRIWTIEIIEELQARTRGVYDKLIGKGYREYASITGKKRRRLLRLGGRRAVRQDHRHLRHRPYPAAASAAIEAERNHGHSGRAARRATHPQGGQEDGRGRRDHGRAVRHFWRQGHSLRAVGGRSSTRGWLIPRPHIRGRRLTSARRRS